MYLKYRVSRAVVSIMITLSDDMEVLFCHIVYFSLILLLVVVCVVVSQFVIIVLFFFFGMCFFSGKWAGIEAGMTNLNVAPILLSLPRWCGIPLISSPFFLPLLLLSFLLLPSVVCLLKPYPSAMLFNNFSWQVQAKAGSLIWLLWQTFQTAIPLFWSLPPVRCPQLWPIPHPFSAPRCGYHHCCNIRCRCYHHPCPCLALSLILHSHRRHQLWKCLENPRERRKEGEVDSPITAVETTILPSVVNFIALSRRLKTTWLIFWGSQSTYKRGFWSF